MSRGAVWRNWSAVVCLALTQLGACKGKSDAGLQATGSTAPIASAPKDGAACNDADPKVCFERARRFELGTSGSVIDKEAAIGLYTAACDRNVADACSFLGHATRKASRAARWRSLGSVVPALCTLADAVVKALETGDMRTALVGAQALVGALGMLRTEP